MPSHAQGNGVHGTTADALQRRCDQQTAIAELATLAITSSDVAMLVLSAQHRLRATLGVEIDAGLLLNAERLDEHIVHGHTFAPGDIAFVREVANVLRLVADRGERERSTLARVEGRFGRIFQNSPVALGMSTMSDGRIIDVNERWLSLFGYRRDEVIGRTSVELHITPDSGSRAAIVRNARAGGIMRDVETQVRTKSGALIDIIVSAVPIDNADARGELWLSATVDITDRKHAEAERTELLSREQGARAEAEQALEKVRAVYAIADSVTGHSSLGELLGDVLRRLRRTLQVDHASLFLLDDERKTLFLRAVEGAEPAPAVPPPEVRMPVGSGMSGKIAAEGRPLIVNDYSTIDSTQVQTIDPEGVRRISSVMGAPFIIGDQVAGVVVVSTRQPRQFSEEDLRLLVLATDRVGPAIERGRLIERIRSGIERQRSLSRRLLTAHEDERRRLAVELHDELGQVLTAVKINLESLARAKTPGGTFATMTATIQSVDEAMLRVRDMALDLRPSVLDDLGLAAAIRWYIDRFARAGPIETHVSIDTLPSLDTGLATACFRVAQEALTNIDRHAHARHVWIDLHVLDGAIELSVRDDGIGFDVAAARARAIGGESVGLLGMQERVSLVDGEYEIVQVPAGGTEVRARFPLAPKS